MYGDVGIERNCVYFDSHLFCLFVLEGCLGHLLDVILGFSRALLIQLWKLRVERRMFAISYFGDKHIYHSD